MPGELPKAAEGIAEPESGEDAEEAAKKQEAEIKRLIRDIKRLVKGNKLPAALEKLEMVEQIAPENVEVFELQADVHEKLGQKEEAEADRARIKELKAKQTGGEDGAGEEAEGDGASDEGTTAPPP